MERDRKDRIAVSACMLIICLCTACWGRIIYVDDDAAPGGDGSSWARAYPYLQDALAQAAGAAKPLGIHVAQGAYKPDQGAALTPGDQAATLQLLNGVSLQGGYAGWAGADPNVRDVKLYETVLSQSIYLLGDEILAGDPHAPAPPDVNVPWDPALHLAAGWWSMTLSTELCNPAEPELSQIPPVRSLSFAGRINVIDPNGLVALAEAATDALAFDETGKQLRTIAPLPSSPSYRPLIYTEAWPPVGPPRVSIAPYSFVINMSMKPKAAFPLVLSRLEWSMSVLLSDRFEVIDIPFAPTTDWTEMTPGVEILVEQAIVQEKKYDYRIKVRYDRNKTTYLDARDRRAGYIGRISEQPYSWSSANLPEMVVTGIDVVDREGHSVWDGSTGSRSRGTFGCSFSDSGNQRTATRGGVGYCSTCGTAAFIRHVIAFKPYNRQVRFVLQDVPVPSL